MELRKVLIADGSDDFLLAMAQALQQHFHVLCCRDGKQALSLLRSEHCDLLVLDLMLPEMDGITLLETAAAENIRPTVLATTLLLNEYVIHSVHRLDVDYLVRKPCDIAAIAARMLDLSGQLPPPRPKQDDRKFVTEFLISLSLVPKHDGTKYLLECILSYAKNPNQAFTKELYPSVGKLFAHSGGSVERSMRNALDVAWASRDDAAWQQYFPPSEKRPTSSDFIACMAEILRKSWE